MSDTSQTSGPQKELDEILQSARALGVEIDEEEAIQWLTAVSASKSGASDVRVDHGSGVFGHRVVLLDFDPADLLRLRYVAGIVELEDRENVETAIALSGSSAQSEVQTFPGDFDYFERVNIKASTREDACRILGDVIREKALDAAAGPGYLLTEVRFGSYQEHLVRGENSVKPGDSITWSPAEVEAGHVQAVNLDGNPRRVDWEEVAQDPGWCKIDWILVDPGQPRAIKASNMLDATWEAPDGTIKPLDGFIDPYYQEVYLDAESIPLFTKIAEQIGPDAQHQYVRALEGEARNYMHPDHPNWGKVAKRLYNIFRLTGQFEEAAYVRELFDEPAALLYQVSALLDGLVDLGGDTETIERDTLRQEIDGLIADISSVADGPEETNLIMSLLKVRDDITGLRDLGDEWAPTLISMQHDIGVLVNEYFEGRLKGMPTIADYLERIG